MPDAVIGLDIGTTSIKALVLDASGRVVSVAKHEVPAQSEQPDRREQDPDDVLDAALRCLREVAGSGPGIRGLAVSAAMHSLMAVDASDRPITGSITWADNRASEQAKRLKIDRDWLAIYRRTGVPLHAMTPVPKLLWFREREPELFQRAARWVSIKDYILFRLCGHWAIDHSCAATSGLLAIDSLDWDEELLDLLQLDRGQLSRIVGISTELGTLRPEVAEATGLSPDCRVVAGASDGALANVGVGAVSDGVAAASIGTSGAVRLFASQPILDPLGRLFCYPYDGERFLVGGPINNGGVALQWVRDEFFPELVEEEAEGGRDAYEVLDEIAGRVEAGSGGLLFLPYLLGERAPYWNADAKGVLFGLQIDHGRADLVRATMEGVMHQMSMVTRVLEESVGDISEVRVTGGFARSKLWCQMMADVFGHSVLVPANEHGSAIGAALLAGSALDLSVSVQAEDEDVPRYLPDPARAAVYANAAPVFERLYARLEPEFSADLEGGDRPR